MTWTWILISLIILVFFVILLIRKTANNDITERLPYKKKEYLLSKSEKNFYEVLKMAVEDKYTIFAKVRLADLVYVPNGADRLKYWNKIQSKHIDFLLCEKDSIKPVLAIELDDSTHNEPKRVERDNFINSVFDTVGLRILHIKASSTYNHKELNKQIFSNI